MNAGDTIPSYEDVLAFFGFNKIGMVDKQSGRRLVIVAEINKNDHGISVEVVNSFNAGKTAINTEFWLVVRPPAGVAGPHVPVNEDAIRLALKEGRDVVATAIHDQFLWFAQNFPSLCPELIEQARLQDHIRVPGVSGGNKRI